MKQRTDDEHALQQKLRTKGMRGNNSRCSSEEETWERESADIPKWENQNNPKRKEKWRVRRVDSSLLNNDREPVQGTMRPKLQRVDHGGPSSEKALKHLFFQLFDSS